MKHSDLPALLASPPSSPDELYVLIWSRDRAIREYWLESASIAASISGDKEHHDNLVFLHEIDRYKNASDLQEFINAWGNSSS